jgi:hypothetical protein
MPLAGESAKSRARAHYRWGARYLREDEPRRASAHFGRAEHYMTLFGTQLPYSLGPESNSDFYSADATKAREMRATPLQRLRKETDLLVDDLRYTSALVRTKVKEQEKHAQRLLMPGQQHDHASQAKAQYAVRSLKRVTGIISEIDRMYYHHVRALTDDEKIGILNKIKQEVSKGLAILKNADPDSMALDTLKQARRPREDSYSDDEEDRMHPKRHVGAEEGGMDEDGIGDAMGKMSNMKIL